MEIYCAKCGRKIRQRKRFKLVYEERKKYTKASDPWGMEFY